MKLLVATAEQSDAPIPVSVATPLLPFTSFNRYQQLLFAVQNLDPTNVVVVTIETSEDGVSVDTQLVYQYQIGPGQQCSLEIGPGNLRNFFSITAQTQGPSFPTADVTFQVKAGMDASWVVE